MRIATSFRATTAFAATLAPTAALIGLAWTMPACCCGVPPPKPGPPGSISGQVVFTDPEQPKAVAVYAVDTYAADFDGRSPYVIARLTPPQTQFTLSVPPSEYKVVARLDSDPISAAGYTFLLGAAEPGNHALMRVRVESKQAITGINVGDWGGDDSRRTLMAIDVHGSPLTLHPASPKSVPSRRLPAGSHEPITYVSKPSSGYGLQLPGSWLALTVGISGGNDDYYANEDVVSPLQLDSHGIWLTVRWYIELGCPTVDWRYATARIGVRIQGTTDDFYFENPSGPLGVQPFTGYVLRGGHTAFGNCLAFIFTGTTKQALESNLPDIAGILSTATFVKPQY